MRKIHCRNNTLAFFLAAVLPGLLAGACSQQKTTIEEVVPQVKAQPVRRGIARLSLRYTAALRGSIEVRVFSQIPDRIRALNVELGDTVRKGQLLAVISHDALSSGLEASLAMLGSSKATLSSLQSERGRVDKLYRAQAVGEGQWDRLNKQVEAGEANVRQLEAMVSQAATQQGKAFVRAPIDGIVGERFVEQGDMAAPQIPLVTIVQTEELKAEVKVPEFELPRIEGAIREGYPVWVRVAGLLDEHGERVAIEAHIVRISPTIDLATRLATVEVRFDNRTHRVRPGVLAEVEVVVAQNEHALLVPAYAVLNEGAVGAVGEGIRHVVFLVEGDVARRRPVEIGMRLSGNRNGDAGMVEVKSGVAEGDRVVVRGQHMLRDGQKVQVAETEKTAPPEQASGAEGGGGS